MREIGERVSHAHVRQCGGSSVVYRKAYWVLWSSKIWFYFGLENRTKPTVGLSRHKDRWRSSTVFSHRRPMTNDGQRESGGEDWGRDAQVRRLHTLQARSTPQEVPELLYSIYGDTSSDHQCYTLTLFVVSYNSQQYS